GEGALDELMRILHIKDLNAILKQSQCPLRGMRRPPFPSARVEGATARQIDSRRARAYRDGSDSILRADRRAKKSFGAARCARRSWTWLFKTWTTAQHAFRRRIAAAQAR